MDKRTLLAFVLSFLILFLWSVFFTPKKHQGPEKPHGQTVHSQSKPAPKKENLANPVTSPQPTALPVITKVNIKEKLVLVDTPLYKAEISNVGPTIKSFKLKRYRETIDPDSPLVDLVDPGVSKEFLWVGLARKGSESEEIKAFETEATVVKLDKNSSVRTIKFYGKTDDGLYIEKALKVYPDQYRIDVTVRVINQSSKPLKGEFVVRVNGMPPKKKHGYYAPYTGLIALANGKIKKIKFKKKKTNKELKGNLQWVAYQKNYFMCAVIPEGVGDAVFRGIWDPDTNKQTGLLLEPAVSISPQSEKQASFTLFLGPRQLTVLKRFGKNLDKAVDFGWTNIIAKPLLYVLRFFYKYIHNYGVSIILLTILIKILFWPLTHKSYKSMKEMQKLQPIMAKIKEKYKNDREQMNKEMMALYRTYKVNPMSGCLPMIIQIPVFFALYRILGKAIELRHAPFFLWINDLSAPDRLFHFSFKVPFMAPPYGIPVLTLLMGASMYIQQKMTPTPGDPTQAKFMMFLPIIFTFMFINFPSGLVLYWLVNNILSIGQQYRIHKRPA